MSEKEITKELIDEFMMDALKHKRLVDNWWISPTYLLDLKTPKEVFMTDGGPQKIYDYVRSLVLSVTQK